VRQLAVCVVAVSVLAAAGCGSSDDNGADEGAGSAAETVEIRETEFSLDPATVTLDTAGTYTFHVVNAGGTTHALEIEGNGVEEESATLAAGESGDVTVELDDGTYELYCPIDDHREQGMEGTLTVGSGASASSGAPDDDDDAATTGDGYG